MFRTTARFINNALTARSECGRSIFAQGAEALALRLGPGRLGLSDYFDYRLYRTSLPFSEKKRFVGWAMEPELDRCNDSRWHEYADDKILLHRLLISAGIPCPDLQATYLAVVGSGPDYAALESITALTDWLRHQARYPVFVKPSHAGFGRGAQLIREYHAGTDDLLMDDASRVRVEKFARGLENPEGRGILFQSLLRPHVQLAELCCERLSTARVMVLIEPGRAPEIYRAVWKIPRKFNIIDNFESGSTGNLLGRVDLVSGAVKRVIQGYGPGIRELDSHPDSGLPFAGLHLPDWPQAVEVILAAAAQLPELRFQHWDLAFTDRGPVPIEVNLFAAGGTELSQLVDGIGLLEDRLLVLNGLRPLYP